MSDADKPERVATYIWVISWPIKPKRKNRDEAITALPDDFPYERDEFAERVYAYKLIMDCAKKLVDQRKICESNNTDWREFGLVGLRLQKHLSDLWDLKSSEKMGETWRELLFLLIDLGKLNKCETWTIPQCIAVRNICESKLQLSRLDNVDLEEALQELVEAEFDVLGEIPCESVDDRLDVLRSLKKGWLEGGGKAPSDKVLNFVYDKFTDEESLPMPYIFPTEAGGIELEWTCGSNDVSIEIQPDLTSEFHILNLGTGEDHFEEVDLSDDEKWNVLFKQLKDLLT